MTDEKSGEKRKYRRAKKTVRVDYKPINKDVGGEGDGVIRASMEDISIGGIQLLLDERIVNDQAIEMFIYMDDAGEPMATLGKVKWYRYDPKIGMFRTGVEFWVERDEYTRKIRAITGE